MGNIHSILVTDNNISFILNGEPHVIGLGNSGFEAVKEKLQAEKPDPEIIGSLLHKNKVDYFVKHLNKER